MILEMSHWERVRAALKGEETDRVPISLWRHWPVEDETPLPA
jgi:uroporphyrinogen decarboxylase